MDAADVRYLVKDAVAAWLASLEQPLAAEFDTVDTWWSRRAPYDVLARMVVSGPNWLPLLIDRGAIERWLAAGGAMAELAFWLLGRGCAAHIGPVDATLRRWWGLDAARQVQLLTWFKGLRPDGPIGSLELLYRDVLAVTPSSALEPRFDANFDLGAWAHTDHPQGARILALWLERWMPAFPDSHPFGADEGGHDRYWWKDLADNAPIAFLDAVWPAFVEALRRDGQALATGRIHYRTIRLPFDIEEESFARLVEQALAKAASDHPAQVEALLDALPAKDSICLWLQLRAIAGNGAALHHRLTLVLSEPALLAIEVEGGSWRPFAQAARAAFPHLSVAARRQLESRVLAHRPEIRRACEALRWPREAGREVGDRDRAEARWRLRRSGEAERAILATIGREALSGEAGRRLDELDRKFPGEPLPPERLSRGGYVRSPISLEKAAAMNDGQWLSAIARYDGAEERVFEADSVIGGAEELAQVLQARVKAEPKRFVDLLGRLPAKANPAYARAVLLGLREADRDVADAALALRAYREAGRWGHSHFTREICWLVARFPALGSESDVMDTLVRLAAQGEASDTEVRTINAPEKRRVGDLLNGGGDLEASGFNSERGAAWEALASVLWNADGALERVTALLDHQIEAEPLTSVRMRMFGAANAILKYDLPKGLQLFNRLAAHDLRAVQNHGGRHVFRWAMQNHPAEIQPLLERLVASDDTSLRVLGLAHQAWQALNDESLEPAFAAGFEGDVLRRRVAAFISAANVTDDVVGDRAANWLRTLFDDPDPDARREATHVSWDLLLEGEHHLDLTEAFLRSPSFADEPDGLTRALETRVDRFPELTFGVIERVLQLQATWITDGRRRHFWATHRLGRVLVRLYRAVDGDAALEDRLLDLFDTYLARDVHDMRDQMSAYERD